MSFLTGQLHSVLKTVKFISIYKKQKIDYANYRPLSLLPYIEKRIEKLTYERLSKFLELLSIDKSVTVH